MPSDFSCVACKSHLTDIIHLDYGSISQEV